MNGFAIITFSSPHDAQMAIEELNGKPLLGNTLSANLTQSVVMSAINQPLSPIGLVNIPHTSVVQTAGSHGEEYATKLIQLNPPQWNLLIAMNSAKSNLFQELLQPFTANPDVKIDLDMDKAAIHFTGKPAAVQSAYTYFRNGLLNQIPMEL